MSLAKNILFILDTWLTPYDKTTVIKAVTLARVSKKSQSRSVFA